MGNNQMLVGDPQTGELRRFLVGPNQCEVTVGPCSSAFSVRVSVAVMAATGQTVVNLFRDRLSLPSSGATAQSLDNINIRQEQ